MVMIVIDPVAIEPNRRRKGIQTRDGGGARLAVIAGQARKQSLSMGGDMRRDGFGPIPYAVLIGFYLGLLASLLTGRI